MPTAQKEQINDLSDLDVFLDAFFKVFYLERQFAKKLQISVSLC